MIKGEEFETDYAVVGCGIAGLRAAVELAEGGARVTVLTKTTLTESNTQYAQGGIAAALSDEDEVGLHLQDTLAAGDGLCMEEAVRTMVEEGPGYIQQLIDWGTQFDRQGTRLAFTREGAHSRSRVLHAQGDSTGREIVRALFAKARSLGSLEFYPYAFTTDLLADGNRVCGLQYLDEYRGRLVNLRARGVLLATGGLGQVFAETTNPAVATGDGVAIACRAGALISDMEFIQFHPTALFLPGAPRFLLSEALRGEGGVLRNIDMERFMPRYNADGELALRDIVSRAIVTEMRKTGSDFVYLDMTELPAAHLRRRFPRIYETCLSHNLDITDQLIPVRPAAHYSMGGVATDLNGRTSLEGLFAAGEVTCTGVHGANRLASNSLLEGLVFGARAGRAMLETGGATQTGRKHESLAAGTPAGPPETHIPPEVETWLERIRQTLWRSAGVIREAGPLESGLEELQRWERPQAEELSRFHQEAANQLLVGELIIRSALARRESRGAHYRKDFPFKQDDAPPRHSYVERNREVSLR